MAVDIRVEIDQSEWHRLFESPTGEVAADMRQRARQIERSAVRRAPKDTGELKTSVDMIEGNDADGLYWDIGTPLLKGLFQELGHVTPDGVRVAPRRFLRPALRAGKRVRTRH